MLRTHSARVRQTAAVTAVALALGACADQALTAPDAAAAIAAPTDAASSLAVAASTDQATLPTKTVDTRWVAPTGRKLRVPAGASLQAAIDTAVGGDVILLAPGARYVGNFALRAKPAGTKWITITTDTVLPAPGTRMTPALAAPLAKIVAYKTMSALSTKSGAHHYRVVGVELMAAEVSGAGAVVAFGDGGSGQSSLTGVPSNLILDRAYVHGHPGLGLRRCVALNSASTAVIDSYLSECHSLNDDSQAIAGWNGPGPFKIENNYLEAAGENIMFGGATPAIAQLIPSDIEIRRNHIFKPLAWRDVWLVKNALELKCAQRLLVEGNVFENVWADGQQGFAIVMKSEGPASQPWIITQDVTLRYNVLRNVASGISITANPYNRALPARRFRIEHTFMDGIGASNGTTGGRAFSIVDDLWDVSLVHNTVIPNITGGRVLTFDGQPGGDLTVRDNVWIKGSYGMNASGKTEGSVGLGYYFPSYTYVDNVQVGFSTTKYPAANFVPATIADVGFVDYAGGNYRIAPTSPYYRKASDRTNPGVYFDTLAVKTAGVVAPAAP